MYLAYLDPGSGSMLMAALVAGVSGVAVAARVWWRRMLVKIRRHEPVNTEAPAQVQDG
jgi:hypothetical protein